jgi:hypothetical protein
MKAKGKYNYGQATEQPRNNRVSSEYKNTPKSKLPSAVMLLIAWFSSWPKHRLSRFMYPVTVLSLTMLILEQYLTSERDSSFTHYFQFTVHYHPIIRHYTNITIRAPNSSIKLQTNDTTRLPSVTNCI